MRTVGVLLAAGSGQRLGLAIPKAFVDLEGQPMFELSLKSMAASGAIEGIVLVVPPGNRPDPVAQAIDRWSGTGAETLTGHLPPRLLAAADGGDTRQASVRLGLAAVPEGVEVVVIHDAARPLASPELFRRVVAAVESADGAVPVIASPDTVKRVSAGQVVETIARDEVGLVQTPQAFRRSALVRAHDRATGTDGAATDDAMLLEAAGFSVVTVEGEPTNFKITTVDDLQRAADALRRRDPGP